MIKDKLTLPFAASIGFFGILTVTFFSCLAGWTILEATYDNIALGRKLLLLDADT